MELSLKKIAQEVDGEVIGDAGIIITGVNSLDAAESGDISFFADRRYKEALKKTRASAIIASAETNLYNGPKILVSNSVLAFAASKAASRDWANSRL